MKDPTALAYVNMYAILGAIPLLCRLDEQAAALIRNEKVSVGFSVRGGPAATLVFSDGTCTLRDGVQGANIRLPFSSPEKFNGMIDGTVTPIPSRGFTRIGFLLRKFMPLTGILTRYLRATPEDLSDPVFFDRSTTLMLQVIAGAVAQLANHDPVSRVSAGYIVDGNIFVGIDNGPHVALSAQQHRLAVCDAQEKDCLSYMRFPDMKTARALFDGQVNAVVCVGLGQIRIGGMISQIDNLNRILDRVACYLA